MKVSTASIRCVVRTTSSVTVISLSVQICVTTGGVFQKKKILSGKRKRVPTLYLNEETHWRVVIFVWALAVEEAFTVAYRNS
jgi:hypothetical protein